MKLHVRNVKMGFATNSSSYHSTLILTEEEYNKWKNGQFKADVTYEQIKNDNYDEDTGYYYYIESQSERMLENGVKVVAITYCETSEY